MSPQVGHKSYRIQLQGHTSQNDIMILVNVEDRQRMHPPNEAMMVGTSLTEMKSEMLSMIPSKAEPKLRMSAGSN